MFIDKILDSLRDDRNSIDKLAEIFENLRLVPRVLEQVLILREEVKQIQMDLTKLAAAIGLLSTDFTTFSDDLKTFLAALPKTDPAQQAQIDGFTTSLTSIDDGLKAADASLKAGTTPPAGGGV